MSRERRQLREAYGEALVQLGEENPRVVVVDADMAAGTMTLGFKERFPERFYDVGVAEQHLVGAGAGLSLTGLIPYVNTFAWLLVLRAGDMLRTLVAYARTNVKIIAGYGGFSGPMDGATHQSVMDLAVVRALPGMTVITAGDPASVRWAVAALADHQGPAYLRLSRAEVEDFHAPGTAFRIGKAVRLREGRDVCLLTCGPITTRVLAAAADLAAEGIRASVLEVHTLKPLDEELIAAELAACGAAVTVEEHSILGGLGSAVAELAAERCPVPVLRIGIRDVFGETGPYERLLDAYGMAVGDITAAARRCLELKQKRRRGACRPENSNLG
jgi:transketolase